MILGRIRKNLFCGTVSLNNEASLELYIMLCQRVDATISSAIKEYDTTSLRSHHHFGSLSDDHKKTKYWEYFILRQFFSLLEREQSATASALQHANHI